MVGTAESKFESALEPELERFAKSTWMCDFQALTGSDSVCDFQSFLVALLLWSTSAGPLSRALLPGSDSTRDFQFPARRPSAPSLVELDVAELSGFARSAWSRCCGFVNGDVACCSSCVESRLERPSWSNERGSSSGFKKL